MGTNLYDESPSEINVASFFVGCRCLCKNAHGAVRFLFDEL